ncbi:MAG: c-type cytochrome [Pirellulales bacterium]|nr:c-type cytochrome [Pirellulales bacterium]MDO7688196.1 c-type cytochrome [Pirellulales bacterium]
MQMHAKHTVTVFILLGLLFVQGAGKDVLASNDVDSFQLVVTAVGSTTDTSVQAALLKGMLLGLEGRRSVRAPEGWSTLSTTLACSTSASVRQHALALSQIFGDTVAVASALECVQDSTIAAAQRCSTLSLLLGQQNQEASQLLKVLIDEPALTLSAIRGYAIVRNDEAPAVLISRYSKLNAQHQRAVIETLASRKAYAEALLEALKMNQIQPSAVPVQVARTLKNLLGKKFTDVYGALPVVGAEREHLIKKYKKLCKPSAVAAADASRGRAVFQKTCAACHVLYGEGGKVGPELTGANRANLDYILLNSVYPSLDVPHAYRTVSVLTVDGRVVNGVLAEEDGTKIVLRTPEQPRVVIAKEDIDFRKISPQSMMPDGQLDAMKPQEVIDLVKYLRTTEQVELP